MNNKEVISQDIPIWMWLSGDLFVGVGGFLLWKGAAPWYFSGIFLLTGLLFIALTPIVTVSLDRGSGVIEVRKKSLFRNRFNEVPAHQVASAYVQQTISSGTEGGSSMVYRVVIELENGEVIPLRGYYSSGFKGKQRTAEKIRAALGVPGVDQDRRWRGNSPMDVFTLREAKGQLKATNIEPGEHLTNGVRWELETYTYGAADASTPMYRWLSTDFETPGYFLYLAQKAVGQGQQKGLMNLMGKMLIKQSMRIYGFDSSYAPGIDTASSLEDVDRRLMEQFFIYSSSPVEARRLLNPWTVMPLIGWVDRYALEAGTKNFNQLSVLFSPNGVFVSVLNVLDAAQVDELVSLGVELLRAQGV